MKRACHAPVTDVSKIAKNCSKSTSMVKSWKLDVTKLEVTKQGAFEESGHNKKVVDSKENIIGASPLSKTLNRFNGEYLNSNGVQVAITETFKQLKKYHPHIENVQEKHQVYIICIRNANLLVAINILHSMLMLTMYIS